MLKIKNLTKIYSSGVRAVDDLTLTVNPGEIYGFIGHNGAGKSTTIKAVVGALAFEQGEISINGVSMKDNPLECKKMLAYIPDHPDIYEYLTGEMYLNFICDIFGVSKEERAQSIKHYAEEFEIYDVLGNLISSYSHGMRQKLVLISALIHNPKLLVLDEPFVGLDPIASHKVKKIMAELCQKGCSIFFSTHVLEVAEKLCHRIGIIKNGKLVAEGLVQDVIGDKSLESTFLDIAKESENE